MGDIVDNPRWKRKGKKRQWSSEDADLTHMTSETGPSRPFHRPPSDLQPTLTPGQLEEWNIEKGQRAFEGLVHAGLEPFRPTAREERHKKRVQNRPLKIEDGYDELDSDSDPPEDQAYRIQSPKYQPPGPRELQYHAVRHAVRSTAERLAGIADAVVETATQPRAALRHARAVAAETALSVQASVDVGAAVLGWTAAGGGLLLTRRVVSAVEGAVDGALARRAAEREYRDVGRAVTYRDLELVEKEWVEADGDWGETERARREKERRRRERRERQRELEEEGWLEQELHVPERKQQEEEEKKE